MKKVLTIVLIFALVMAALFGISVLWERNRPVKPQAPSVVPGASGEPGTSGELYASSEAGMDALITDSMDASSATVITFTDDNVTVSGIGVDHQGSIATIAYPGIYLVRGTCPNGQLVVDLGSFSGAVYIVLDGLNLTCDTGPALQVIQADLTQLWLMEGSQNLLCDGEDYLVQEGQEKKTGAAVYSADDLVLNGSGTLTVLGRSADGIRSKDALTIMGGSIAVYSADDGLQSSDYIRITDGSLIIGAKGDGIATTDGFIDISGGRISIASGGDGIYAVSDITVSGGEISAVTYGGPENYASAVKEDLSAKGLKAGGVIGITDGVFSLRTADDAIHADRDISILGGSFDIAAGDDGVSAANVVNIRAVTMDIADCYEALEGDMILLSNVVMNAAAQNNGVDAGQGGVTIYASTLDFTAPCAISSDSALKMLDVDITLAADGSDSLFSFAWSDIIGCHILASADAGRSAVLLGKGVLPGSALFGFAEAVPAGTEFVLTDPAGTLIYSFSFDRDVMEVFVLSDGLMNEQTYTLTAGDDVLSFPYNAAGSVVNEQALPNMSASGGRGGPPMGR